jgi:hypothetical protein
MGSLTVVVLEVFRKVGVTSFAMRSMPIRTSVDTAVFAGKLKRRVVASRVAED